MEYEAQYDPNNDFAIFGVGDHTNGGLQTMKEKMNLADNKEESSEEEEPHSGSKTKSYNSTPSNKVRPILPEDKEIHSDHEWVNHNFSLS